MKGWLDGWKEGNRNNDGQKDVKKEWKRWMDENEDMMGGMELNEMDGWKKGWKPVCYK